MIAGPYSKFTHSKAVTIWTASVSTLLLLFLYLFANSKIGYNVYDEGVVSYGATRILNGDVPYKDFWSIYAPGQFYVVAVLFKLFAKKLAVMRMCSIIISLLTVLVSYSIVRKIVDAKSSFLCLSTLVLSYLFWRSSIGSPTHAAVFWSLLSIYFIVRFVAEKRNNELVIAGIFSGMTLLFKQDIGVYSLFAGSLFLFVYTRLTTVGGNLLNGVKIWSRYISGVSLIVLPVSIYFISRVPFKDLLSDIILFPLKVFPEVRSIPFPAFHFAFDVFPYYFPIIVLIMVSIRLILSYKLKQFGEREWMLLLLLFVGVPFFNQAFIRSDASHQFPASMLSIMLIAGLIDNSKNALYQYPFRAAGYLLIFIYVLSLYGDALHGVVLTVYLLPLVFLSLVSLPLLVMRNNRDISGMTGHFAQLIGFALFLGLFVFFYRASNFATIPGRVVFGLHWPSAVPSRFYFTQGIFVPPEKEKNALAAAQYIKSRVKPDENIFVGNYCHDRILINNVMFYNLVERNSATKYHELHPGLATTKPVQREIVAELKNKNVKYVVLNDIGRGCREPNKSSISSNAFDLDNFLDSEFSVVLKLDDYSVLKRNTN